MYKITNARTNQVSEKQCLLDVLTWVGGCCYREDDEFLIESEGQSVTATLGLEWVEILIENPCQSCGKDPFDCVPS